MLSDHPPSEDLRLSSAERNNVLCARGLSLREDAPPLVAYCPVLGHAVIVAGCQYPDTLQPIAIGVNDHFMLAELEFNMGALGNSGIVRSNMGHGKREVMVRDLVDKSLP